MPNPPMREKELEIEERAGQKVATPPWLDFNFRALTEIEQAVLWILFDSHSAKTNYEIYSELVRQKAITFLERTIYATDKAKTIRNMKEWNKAPSDFAKVLKKEKYPEKVAQFYNRKYGNKGLLIPSFRTIRRLINDFERIGWVGEPRKIKSRTLFFLNEKVAERLRGIASQGWRRH